MDACPDLTLRLSGQSRENFGVSAVLTARYAMLFYVLKRLGLLGDAAKQDARSQHIVLVNRGETEAALKKNDFPS